MTYAAGEALLLTVVRGLTGYDANNTSRGNFRALNKGHSETYIILRPGEFTVNVISLGGLGSSATSTEHSQWTTEVIVYRRYIDDGTTLTDLEANVADIISEIQRYRQLADTAGAVVIARVTGGGPVEGVGPDPMNPLWLRQIVQVVWTEERTITYAE